VAKRKRKVIHNQNETADLPQEENDAIAEQPTPEVEEVEEVIAETPNEVVGEVEPLDEKVLEEDNEEEEPLVISEEAPESSEVKEEVVEELMPNGKKYPELLPPDLRRQYSALDVSARLNIDMILQYIFLMDNSKHIDPMRGAQLQKQLFYSFSLLLNAKEGKFATNTAILFPLVVKHLKGVFAERNINRFYEFVDASERDTKALPYLFELVRLLSDPKSRDTVVRKNIGHLPKALELASSDRGLNEVGRFNVANFLELR